MKMMNKAEAMSRVVALKRRSSCLLYTSYEPIPAYAALLARNGLKGVFMRWMELI